MMLYSDELVLVSKPASQQYNEYGFPVPSQKERIAIFGERKSVGTNEFYKATMAGINCTLKFVVNADEYEGQECAEYAGQIYRIIRSYTVPNGEKTELTLSDMNQLKGSDPVGKD